MNTVSSEEFSKLRIVDGETEIGDEEYGLRWFSCRRLSSRARDTLAGLAGRFLLSGFAILSICRRSVRGRCSLCPSGVLDDLLGLLPL